MYIGIETRNHIVSESKVKHSYKILRNKDENVGREGISLSKTPRRSNLIGRFFVDSEGERCRANSTMNLVDLSPRKIQFS